MLFEIDPEPLGEELTALGGVPLVVRAFSRRAKDGGGQGEPHAEEIWECAEVPFVPGEKSEHKQTEPLSHLAGWGFGFASGRAVCLRAVLPPGILRW